MNDYKKELLTEFIRDLIYDPEGRHSEVQEDVESRAELAMVIKGLRDDQPKGVHYSPIIVKQTPGSAADLSKQIREGLRNNSLGVDEFGGYGPDLHGVGVPQKDEMQ